MYRSALILLATIAFLIDAQMIPPPGATRPPPPSKRLGEACTTDRDCLSAWAGCPTNTKKCTCRDGFTTSNGNCVSPVLDCPIGDPLKANGGAVQLCTLKTEYPPAPSAASGLIGLQWMAPKYTDTCPPNYYCFLHNSNAPRSVEDGHCCPKAKKICPSGAKPDLTKSCGFASISFGQQQGNGNNQQQQMCPYTTHTCVSVGCAQGPGSDMSSICCPQACSNDDFLKGDRCLSYARIGEACTDNEQCSRSNSSCINGKCTCPKGSIPGPSGGDYWNDYCYTPQCYSFGGPNGYATSKVSLDANGNLRTCTSSGNCASTDYCDSQMVCCPKPAAVSCADGRPAGAPCSIDSNSYQQPAVNGLNMRPPVDPCAANKGFCMNRYWSMEGGVTKGQGQCCPVAPQCPMRFAPTGPNPQACPGVGQAGCSSPSQCVQSATNSAVQYICCSTFSQGNVPPCRSGLAAFSMNNVTVTCSLMMAACPAGFVCELSPIGTYQCCPATSGTQTNGQPMVGK